jgi:hypothetical protein
MAAKNDDPPFNNRTSVHYRRHGNHFSGQVPSFVRQSCFGGVRRNTWLALFRPAGDI